MNSVSSVDKTNRRVVYPGGTFLLFTLTFGIFSLHRPVRPSFTTDQIVSVQDGSEFIILLERSMLPARMASQLAFL